MSRFFIRFWNAPFLIGLVIVGLSIKTALFFFYQIKFIHPDLILFVIIWCALKRNFIEGGILTLIFANIAEIHSACPQGYFITLYMTLYLVLRYLNQFVLIFPESKYFRLTFLCFLSVKLGGALFIYLLNGSYVNASEIFGDWLIGGLFEASIGLWIYPLLRKFDWMTYKDPKRSKILEEEFNLVEEGL